MKQWIIILAYGFVYACMDIRINLFDENLGKMNIYTNLLSDWATLLKYAYLLR